MFHGTNTRRLLLSGNKEQQVHAHRTPVSTQAATSLCFHPISCGWARRSQRFPQNNVTRRGIPVRPRKRESRGGRRACPNRAGWRHWNQLLHTPGDPSLSLPPPLCLCWRRRNLMCTASCWLAKSSVTGWGRLFTWERFCIFNPDPAASFSVPFQ